MHNGQGVDRVDRGIEVEIPKAANVFKKGKDILDKLHKIVKG